MHFNKPTGDSDALRSLRNSDLINDSVDFGLYKWPKEKTNIYLCASWGTRWMLARSWFARMTPALTGTGLLCSDARKSPEWGHGQGRTEAEWKSACGPTALKGDINLHTASVCLHTLCWQLRGLQAPTSGRAESQYNWKNKKRGLSLLLGWAGWGRRAPSWCLHKFKGRDLTSSLLPRKEFPGINMNLNIQILNTHLWSKSCIKVDSIPFKDTFQFQKKYQFCFNMLRSMTLLYLKRARKLIKHNSYFK